MSLWAHRGAWNGNVSEQNTLSAIQRAIDENWAGVEIDAFFSSSRFLVQHDADHAGATLYLSQVVPLLASSALSLWLDFKNLRAGNALAAQRRLHELLAPHNLSSRVFIESTNIDGLRGLNDGKLRGQLWLPALRVTDDSDRECLLQAVNEANVSVVSAFHNDVNEAWMRAFGHLQVHLFTVNSRSRAQQLIDLGADVILTDVDYRSEIVRSAPPKTWPPPLESTAAPRTDCPSYRRNWKPIIIGWSIGGGLALMFCCIAMLAIIVWLRKKKKNEIEKV